MLDVDLLGLVAGEGYVQLGEDSFLFVAHQLILVDIVFGFVPAAKVEDSVANWLAWVEWRVVVTHTHTHTHTHTPSSRAACLSCIKPLNGASPVPGPTMTMGQMGRYGRRRVE